MSVPPHRNHPGYWAFLGHRLSGLALALFLGADAQVNGNGHQGVVSLTT